MFGHVSFLQSWICGGNFIHFFHENVGFWVASRGFNDPVLIHKITFFHYVVLGGIVPKLYCIIHVDIKLPLHILRGIDRQIILKFKAKRVKKERG